MCQVSDDLGNLFCALHDGVDGATFRAAVERWDADGELRVLTRDVEQQAVDGTLDGPALAASCSADPGRSYAAARGLDRAFAHVNPATAAVPPPALAEYALRYAETGRLDTGAAGGGLLPRFVRPARQGQLPDDLQQAFGAVVRPSDQAWAACDHVALPSWSRLGRRDRERGLRIAATPLIAEPEELLWQVVERGGRRFYRIAPADHPATRERIARIVDALDRHRAAVAVAPELCLTPRLLEDWQQVLAGRAGAAAGALRLVLVGTGNVDGAEPPSNTAVLLDAQTGEALVHQRKVFPFNFTQSDLELWGLDGRLPAPIDEDLSPGARVAVIEAGGVRLAILVCEDLARLHAFALHLYAHGVSHILVPVFARPTKDRRWERARAEAYSESAGASIIVANSLVMARVLQVHPAGTALAVAPGGAAVGRAAGPDDVVVFDLHPDGPELIP